MRCGRFAKKAKFQFCDLDNLDIVKKVLNYNFPCKCSHDTQTSQLKEEKIRFKYKSGEENGDKKTMLSKINEFLDEHLLAPNFQYYKTHDFHKLPAKTPKEKTFSVMHTNICSLNANAEHLCIRKTVEH